MTTQHEHMKPIERLAVEDFAISPVWEIFDDESDETHVRPIDEIPVRSLELRLVGTKVQLSNGGLVWATIGNVDVANPNYTKHVLALSIEKSGEWFHLARYHDATVATFGPDALSEFLGIPVDEIFPISYDLTPYAIGERQALIGVVTKEPAERIRRADLIKMAANRSVREL